MTLCTMTLRITTLGIMILGIMKIIITVKNNFKTIKTVELSLIMPSDNVLALFSALSL
jgi:hypothetical protein